VMMLLNVSVLPTVAVFNLGVVGLEFFLLNYAFDIQQKHGALNSRQLIFRSARNRRRD